MVFHGSLVVGGYFLYQSIDRAVVLKTQQGRPTVQLTSRQVQVQTEGRPAVSTEPVVRESASSSSEPVEVEVEAQQQTPANRPSSKATQSPTTLGTQPAYPKARPGAVSNPSAPKPAGTPSPTQDLKPAGPPPDWRRELPTEPGQGGENGTQSNVTRRARPLSQPEFNLTRRFPGLSSVQVKARFDIAEDGSYEPTLLTTTGDPTADVVIMGKLLEYKWLPAMEKGVPVKDSRVLDISLEG